MSKHTKLRAHYISTKKYLDKNPNDTVARESFNQFIMALTGTNQTVYQEVTNSMMTDDESNMVRFLHEPKIKVDKKKKFRDNEDEFEDEFYQDYP